MITGKAGVNPFFKTPTTTVSWISNYLYICGVNLQNLNRYETLNDNLDRPF
jgi:hypothetical protein